MIWEFVPKIPGKFYLHLSPTECDLVIYKRLTDRQNSLWRKAREELLEIIDLYRFSEDQIVVPLIIMEVKNRSVSSHELLLYSAKARKIKNTFPFTRYFLVCNYSTKLELTLARHGQDFDGIYVLHRKKDGTRKPTADLEKLLTDTKKHIRLLQNEGILGKPRNPVDLSQEVWVFGYGSLIWDRSCLLPVREEVGYIQGWHRDWTWISKSRRGAPTCSLRCGGKVKGVFLKLDPRTWRSDLEALRGREVRSSEKTVETTVGATLRKIHFWTEGNNLGKFDDLKGLRGRELYGALARRAKMITFAGTDGKTAEDYALAVHEFDPDDEVTRLYVEELRNIIG